MKRLKTILTAQNEAFLDDGGGFFLATLLLVCFLAVLMQINSIIRITEEVNRQLEKAATIAIKGSVLDDWRMDYIARIDTDAAEDIFNEFLIENMHMTANGPSTYARFDSGTLRYSFHIDHVSYDQGGSLTEREGIPRIEAKGHIYIPASIFPDLTAGFTFDIPFHIVASNRRMVYEGDM